MSLENFSYYSVLACLETSYILTCFNKHLFVDFQGEEGIKLFKGGRIDELVSIDKKGFPTGFILIMDQDGTVELDVFVAESNRRQGLAEKLTRAAEVYVGPGKLIKIALTIPADKPEHEKMRTMLLRVGYENGLGNRFSKRT